MILRCHHCGDLIEPARWPGGWAYLNARKDEICRACFSKAPDAVGVFMHVPRPRGVRRLLLAALLILAAFWAGVYFIVQSF